MSAGAEAFALGLQALSEDNLALAIDRVQEALLADPERTQYRHKLLHVLSYTDGYGALPLTVVAALEDLAADKTIDPQPFIRIVKNLLTADIRYTALQTLLERRPSAFIEAVTGGLLDWVLTHPLLIVALRRAIIADESLEYILSGIRRNLSLAPSTGISTFAQQHHDFLEALARQCLATRHIWQDSEDELAAIMTLGQTGQLNLRDLAMLKCLYSPIEALSFAEQTALPSLLKSILAARATEKGFASALPQITPISPGLSQAMQSQYERFPYPMWERRNKVEALSWPEFLTSAVPARPDLTPQPELVEVLIAGCGTGGYAIQLARQLPSARIRAFDLSRTSLGYAARKAHEENIQNLMFGIADIRMLADLPKRFHFIECSGVLHHMSDPAEGLRILTRLLLPGGIFYLSLYSERARQHVSAARQFLKGKGFSNDIAGLRAARAAIFALPKHNPIRRMAETVDFYSADGLHDLLFNIQECAFTPRRLKSLLAKSGLRFLGFVIQDLAYEAAFRAANPSDQSLRDLDLWDDFEKSHPDVFLGMLKMWLQKPVE